MFKSFELKFGTFELVFRTIELKFRITGHNFLLREKTTGVSFGNNFS